MKRIAFWVSYPFMLLVAALPLRALYLFSDILYVIIYHLMGYRRRLVWKNLRRSFPEQDKETLRRWRKKFYHFL
nr:lipid A biosynthesis acyltransferase [Chitinophagales bacterium]